MCWLPVMWKRPRNLYGRACSTDTCAKTELKSNKHDETLPAVNANTLASARVWLKNTNVQEIFRSSYLIL